jgi:hypothetical protein
MAGGSGPRNMNSRYQRARQDADAGENASDGRRHRARSSGSRRGRPPLVRPRDVSEEHRTTDSSEDEQVLATDEVQATDSEGEAQEGGEAGSSSTASAAASPYLRGPSKLPGPPLPPLCPVIRPQGDR